MRPWRARRCRRARLTRSCFVSTDGGAFGALGAARFAEHSPYRSNALAVVSLDAIAGVDSPRLVIDGDTARSPAASLVRTAAVRVLEQSGTRAGAFIRPPPAARPRLSVHLRRAGAVRRPWHPGPDTHDGPGRPVAGLRRRPARCARAWASSAARPRTSSARSTPASSLRRERRATSISERDSCGAGRSSSSS